MKALKVIFFILVVLMVAGLWCNIPTSTQAAYSKKVLPKAGPCYRRGSGRTRIHISGSHQRRHVEDQRACHPQSGKVQLADYAFKIDSFHVGCRTSISRVSEAPIHIKDLVIDGATVISDGLAADNHQGDPQRTSNRGLLPEAGLPTKHQTKTTDQKKAAGSKKADH